MDVVYIERGQQHRKPVRISHAWPESKTAAATVIGLLLAMMNGCSGVVGAPTPNPQPTASFQLSPTNVSFGRVAVGQQIVQNVSVTNSGKMALNITQAKFSDAHFSLSGTNPPLALAVGQSGNFSVAVKPTNAGALTGTLTVQADGVSSPAVVNLAATAVSPQPQISPSATALDFGTLSVGIQGSATVLISNAGGADLKISLLTLSGADFGISGMATPKTISAGQSAPIFLTFRPSAAGLENGSVLITSNDPTNPSLTIAISGTGTTASQGQLSASPTSADFGNLVTGTSVTRQITVTNTGNKIVQISQVTTTRAGFSATGIVLPAAMIPGQTVVLDATFAPSLVGNVAGAIVITSDAQPSSLSIPVSGAGVQPGLSVFPATFNFGNVADGQTKLQVFTITNTGTASLTISQLGVSGAGYSVYGLNMPATIAAGQNATFTGEFAPTGAGSLPATISIASDAPNSPRTVVLSGTGVSGTVNIAASPTSVGFGGVNAGSSSSKPVTITNNGNGTMTISQITVSGVDLTVAGITTPMTLGAGQSAPLNFTFTPTTAETLTGSVTVTESRGSSAVVAVSGTGLQAGVSLTPGSVNFGNVTAGSTNSQTVQINNTGTAILTVTQVNVTGPGFSGGTLTLPVSINPGKSTNFNLLFSPATTGSSVGSVSIQSSAPSSPTVMALNGTGVAAIQTLSINPGALDFGRVLNGTTSTQNIAITNTGNSDVQISQFAATGTGFGITNGSAVTLTPAQILTIGVTFSPTTSGSVNGSVTVTSNATGSPASITLTATGEGLSTHTVALSWDASTSTVAGYNVYRSTSSGNGYMKINGAPVADISYTDSTLLTGTTYYYVTTAVDGSGNESPYSNEAQAIIP